jgi:hypothetical protein
MHERVILRTVIGAPFVGLESRDIETLAEMIVD